MSESVPPRPITFSPSLTVSLTHDCPWRCTYCGFRSDNRGLLPDPEFHRLLEQATRTGATEILVLAGEVSDTLPNIRREIRARGFSSFVDYVRWACERILERGLLPHTNIGAVSRAQFDRLRPVNASMGVMLENVDDDFNRTVAPEKTAAGRLATLEAAGQARVPYTSGILIGLGESPASRIRSLDALAAVHARHGHLQEIILQNFVPNTGSALREAPEVPGPDAYHALIEHWRRVAPDVPVQIPPNLNPHWRELLPLVDDLGGISAEGDEVNPDHPWDPPAVYADAAREVGRELRHRWAVHDRFVREGWVSPRVGQVIDDRERDRAGAGA